MDIRELFNYDPETGIFTNRFSRGRGGSCGDRAGTMHSDGYRQITICGTKHYEHHLVWFYVYGEYPAEIDHINGVRDDNRIANLRPCTRSENCCNSLRTPGESGLHGAYLDKRSLKWYSHIQLGSKVVHLGTFNSALEAYEAWKVAVEQIHGEFAISNRSN